MAASDDDTEGKPLDPEMERVRRKIMRFFAISVGLTLVAVMAVLAAVVYKLNAPGHNGPTPRVSSEIPGQAAPAREATIPLKAGTRIISQSLSGNRLAIDTLLPDGGRQIVIYDIGEGRIVERLNVGEGN